MKKIILPFIFIMIMACTQSYDDASLKGKIGWVRDYNQGIKMASETGKPVMIFFTASWCSWCRKMVSDIFSKDDVAMLSEKLINIYIDVDKDQNIAIKYQVRGVPTVLFLDSGGQIIMEYSGQRTAQDFIAKINLIALKFTKK
ncbi:hypothetical protein GMMP15_1710003 [Candidatus Magnetomoraceae bacterium gMMP-15]